MRSAKDTANSPMQPMFAMRRARFISQYRSYPISVTTTAARIRAVGNLDILCLIAHERDPSKDISDDRAGQWGASAGDGRPKIPAGMLDRWLSGAGRERNSLSRMRQSPSSRTGVIRLPWCVVLGGGLGRRPKVRTSLVHNRVQSMSLRRRGRRWFHMCLDQDRQRRASENMLALVCTRR